MPPEETDRIWEELNYLRRGIDEMREKQNKMSVDIATIKASNTVVDRAITGLVGLGSAAIGAAATWFSTRPQP